MCDFEFNLKMFLLKVEEFEDSASLGATSLEEKIQVKGKGGMYTSKHFLQCLKWVSILASQIKVLKRIKR